MRILFLEKWTQDKNLGESAYEKIEKPSIKFRNILELENYILDVYRNSKLKDIDVQFVLINEPSPDFRGKIEKGEISTLSSEQQQDKCQLIYNEYKELRSRNQLFVEIGTSGQYTPQTLNTDELIRIKELKKQLLNQCSKFTFISSNDWMDIGQL